MRLDHNRNLLKIFQASISAVNGRTCVRKYLANHSESEPTHIIAIGKAASSMMLGALDHAEENLQNGLVVTKQGHLDAALKNIPRINCIESTHPVPDISSLEAGAELIRFIAEAPEQAEFLFLISGGTSSLVEVLPDHVSLEILQQVNDWLLSSGLDIHQINEVRQSLSLIKGGRLAEYLQGRAALCLLISDVPGDDPTIIGSGMLLRKSKGLRLIDENLPGWIRELAERLLPVPDHGDSDNIEVHVIANIQDAMQAAKRQSDELGYHTVLHSELLSGNTISMGEGLAQVLIAEESSDQVIHIWGGETTISLPEVPGHGGRNQSLALAAAQTIKGDNRIVLLAMGTDGTDGPGEDAGALVDNDTIIRGEQDGLDVQDCLDRADAGSFLQASGDLIHTGPTGTNVMDIVIGLKAEV